jgi:signal transduction histidine kinase
MLAAPELTQVLLSVFHNAIQAMDRGGNLLVRTMIKAADNVPPDEGARSGNRMRHGDQAVTIEICDSGPGLTGEQLLKVFDAFYTTKPADVATGMGLTIARKIIDLQGGVLEIANRENGSGLRVSILLRKAGMFQTSV